MQGIETLPYEVYELPMVPEGGIQGYEQAADMLAEFGRNGDTYIVHAAEGETMIPMEVLDNNPRLKKMLFSQMEEMGIEPERYIVGNELNSINPVTGQPEFFLKKAFRKLKKGVKKAVKKVTKVAKKIAPIVLPIVAPFLLPAMPIAFATGIGSLAGGLIAGQDFGTALKGAVISGGLAGLGNMAFGGSEGFGSGKFFGSRAAPGQGLGSFSFRQAVTPVNPLSQAGQTQLAALRAQAAQQAAGTAAPGSAGANVAGENVVSTDQIKAAQTAEPSMFEKAKQAVTDPIEFYQQSVSPSRPGIQPTGTELGVETARLTNAQIAQAQAANKAIEAAGLQAAPIDVAGIQKAAMEQAATNLAPSAISKFAPITALGTGAAVAADYATDGAVLGLFRDDDGDGVDDYTGLTLDEYKVQYPNAFYDQDKFYGDNEYYQDPVFRGSGAPVTQNYALAQTAFDELFSPMTLEGKFGGSPNISIGTGGGQFSPMTVASGGEIVGPGTPTSDSIPAMLSDGEFVMNARAVRGAGGGNRADGAKKMYAMMRNFERRA